MRRIYKFLVFVLLVNLIAVVVEAQNYQKMGKGGRIDKKICITFDDLPIVRARDRIDRLLIADQILGVLDEFEISAAGFVIGNGIKEDDGIIESWLEAGHTIGNHTYSHPDLNEIPVELYKADIAKGREAIDDLLLNYKQEGRYFRYPYLHRGNNYDIKQDVSEYLSAENYTLVPVSIDTDDYAFNLQYEKIYAVSDSIEFVRLGNEYIDHVIERLEAAEELADEIMGRPIKHIILFHANRLNSDFLADMLTEIAALGYRFIPLDLALSDPVYQVVDSYVGAKGLSVLERLARSDPDILPARESH